LLRSLAVAGDFRGQGLGQQLVTHAEGRARTAGAKSLWLLTIGADNFFARLGYESRIDLWRLKRSGTLRSSRAFVRRVRPDVYLRLKD
jgi:N-acetylglutamate synthase-like GNAT family acetyltransferase